jgi:lysophospholipid acyltransferase (LPLAT)-like uncharacterized protein
MSPSAQGVGSIPYKQGLLFRLLLFPVGLVYRLWTRSIRFDYSVENGLKELSASDTPLVFFLWHNRLYLAGEWHRRFRKQRTCYGLISASRDGAWLETFYGWAGILPVRGSQNRRGTQSVRELIKVVRKGNDVGITPDGSRGPIYEAKSGATVLARITRAPVCLLAFEFSSHWKLKSWDRFVIPFPFSKVRVKTKIITLEKLFAEGCDEKATQIAQDELLAITTDH